MWADTLRGARWKYDALGVAIIGLALLVALGLFLRREWGRTFAISLCFIVFSLT
jgi:hypothetical protein